MSRFFIDRPIFAWVIAIAIMLAGLLAINSLAITQYPEIAPPTISISASYPGASAATVEDAVTKVIEQNMTGLDNLDYMHSTSSSSGSSKIALTFTTGTDSDVAQMQVQNQLQLVETTLPSAVIDQGITVTKSSTGFFMVGALVSTDNSLSATDLADYISTYFEDTLLRLNGVGDLSILGSGYAMRIWLDPYRLLKYDLTPADVVSAISAQNEQISVGQLGGLPAVKGQQLNATIRSQSQLKSAEEFRNVIILKTASSGAEVRLGDVARVELGAESYDVTSAYNGKPSAGFGVSLATGANALETADRVRAAVSRIAETLPAGVEVVYPYDTTPFVRLSIEKVVETLIAAIVLVVLVLFVFLQNLRATFIPAITVPVVLLGTFAVLAVAGYSINTLTMFAMVLAIGLLVDDAIVVVENVERIMDSEGLSPRDATLKSMQEITGALVAIAIVLSAVFVPMAFFSGSVGVIYRQFSVTIVSAMLLSVLIALVLTPALCATMLKPAAKKRKRGRAFSLFNTVFAHATEGYLAGVSAILGRPLRFLLVFLAIIGGVAFLFARLPTSFVPQEDQGVLLAQIQLPAGAARARTQAVVEQVSSYFITEEKDAVDAIFGAIGFNFTGVYQNAATIFIRLRDFSERKKAQLSAEAVAARATRALSKIGDAQIFVLQPPAIQHIGSSAGFDLYLQDMAGHGTQALEEARDKLLALAEKSPQLEGVRQSGQADQPQFTIDVDYAKAGALGVSVSDINDLLSTAWAGSYVDDFIDRGNIKPVYVQADAPYRMLPDDVGRWYVNNDDSEMVPMSAFTSTRWETAPPSLSRYNSVEAVEIQGSPADGVSSGDAMSEMQGLVADLGNGYAMEWTGLSRQEVLSGSQAPALYAISILVVFLCLAALYESWSIPLSVILVVPIGALGTLLAAKLFGHSNDVYFKVALLTTVGLAAKNAILIVEFAREREKDGKGLVEVTLEAARLRLRPIVMTSLAFILGVLPLAVASGAGSAAQNAVGVAVLGGMLAASTIGIFYVPLFFVEVTRLTDRLRHLVSRQAVAPAAPTEAAS